MPIRLLFLLTLILLQTAPFLSAQEKRVGTLKFSCVVWTPLKYQTLFYRSGGEFIPLELMPKVRSDLYELKGTPELLFYIKNPEEEQKEPYLLVGRAPIVGTASPLLAFLSEKPDPLPDELPIKVSLIDDSLTNFPPGSFRFVNNTKQSMQIIFPNIKKQLPAKSMRTVEPEIPKKGGFIPVNIMDGNKNIVFESRFFGQPRGRKMIFLNPPSKKGGRVELAFLPQIVPAE